MTDTTNLYLLIFRKQNVVKIGKANEVHNRIKTLQQHWGKADYDSSYHLSAPQDTIFKLERALHLLLHKYNVRFDNGDGKTELFSLEALEIALKYINIFCSNTPEASQIKKGIPEPLQPPPPNPQNQYTALLSRTKTMGRDFEKISEQFSRINRLLIILLRKQTRIAFQYDIVDNTIYFRLKTINIASKIDSNRIMNYFNFSLQDMRLTRTYLNYCGCTIGIDDTLQFHIKLLHLEQPHLKNTENFVNFISYYATQSLNLFMKLPQRSAAATSPIPLLNLEDNYLFN